MDGPLSAPLEQKHARGATAPDKWRPERGYCRRPPATPPRTRRTTPYPSIQTVEPPPTPPLADWGPGPWLNRGGETKLTGEYSAVRARVRLINSRLALPSNTIAGRFHGNELRLVKHHCRGTAIFLSARGKFCVEKKRRVTGEIHRIDVIRSCSFENVVVDY